MSKKHDIGWCQNLAKLKNGKCLSVEYKNNHTKMEWECQEGHRWWAIANGVQGDHWCPQCGGSCPKTLGYCQNLARLKNGKCLSTEYKNALTKMEWECEKGHKWEAIVGSIQQGSWCPECIGKAPHNLKWCQELAFKREGRCISTEYKNNHTKMGWECREGYRWEAITNDIQQGHWCPHCGSKSSKAERQVFSKIKAKYSDALSNIKGLLKDKRFELDIYIPSLRVGIEYDGGYWHSGEKKQKRDLRKNQQCQDANIKLIRISDKNYLADPEGIVGNLLKQLSNPNL